MRKITDKELRLITIVMVALIVSAMVVMVSWQWTKFLTKDTVERTERVKDTDLNEVFEDQEELDKIIKKQEIQKKQVEELKEK